MSAEGFLQSYRLRVTPITPVHVGSGELLEPYAYLLFGQELWIMDPDALLEVLPPAGAEQYLKALEGGPFRAREALMELAKRYDLTPAVAWRAPVGEGFRAFVSEALAEGRGELGVHVLPRSLRGPYLPGSSLKGALRTVFLFERARGVLEAELDEDRGLEWRGRRDLEYEAARWRLREPGTGRVRVPAREVRGRRALGPNQRFEAFLLGNYAEEEDRRTGSPKAIAEITRDPFRSLLVGDSAPIEATAFALVEVFGSRQRPDGATGIRILAETWKEGGVELDFRFHAGLQRHPESALRVRRNEDGVPEKAPTHPPDLEDLAVAAYERYVILAEEELEFYEARGWYPAVRAMERVLDVIGDCLDREGRMKKPYRFPLRLGFGSGARSVRLAEFVEYPDRRDPRIRPVSRKLAEGEPLGWVLAEVVE